MSAEIAAAADAATVQARSMVAGLRETAAGGLTGAVRDLAARSRTTGRLGLGMVPEPAPAVGAELVAVRSGRLDGAGGALVVRSRPGTGTTVLAEVPVGRGVGRPTAGDPVTRTEEEGPCRS